MQIAAGRAILLSSGDMRLDDFAALRFTEAHGQIIPEEEIRSLRPTMKVARGRLLNAATHLFCKNGINATGIDAIIDEAGTAKTTLYKLFGSKTNLVHAVLESEGKHGANGSSARWRKAAATRRRSLRGSFRR